MPGPEGSPVSFSFVVDSEPVLEGLILPQRVAEVTQYLGEMSAEAIVTQERILAEQLTEQPSGRAISFSEFADNWGSGASNIWSRVCRAARNVPDFPLRLSQTPGSVVSELFGDPQTAIDYIRSHRGFGVGDSAAVILGRILAAEDKRKA